MGLRASFGSLAPAVPGELSNADLTVENAGEQVVDVRLSLTGEAAAWGWITPATLRIGPGEQGVARVSFKPPRAPYPPAGPFDVTVAIAGAGGAHTLGGAGGGTEARATLDVAPFADLFATPRAHRRQARPLPAHGREPRQRRHAGDHRGRRHLGQFRPRPPGAGPWRHGDGPGDGTRAPRTPGTVAVLVRPDGPRPAGPGRSRARARLPALDPTLAAVLLALAVAGAGLGALRSGGSSDQPATEEASSKVDPACPARDHLSPDANGIVREGVRPAFDYTFLFVRDGGASRCGSTRASPSATP